MQAFLRGFQLAALALFVLLIGVRAVRLRLRQRVQPIRIGLAHNSISHVGALALFLIVNAWALLVVLDSVRPGGLRWPMPFGLQLVEALPWQVLGLGANVVGFAFLVLALRALGSSWRLGIDEQHPGQLVTWGVYAFSRNPIYLFFDLYFIGTFCIHGELVYLLFAVLMAVALHLQILQEERFLRGVHGEIYARYCLDVQRYIPWHRQAVVALRRDRPACGVAETGSEGEKRPLDTF